jgi:hypothetical protein
MDRMNDKRWDEALPEIESIRERVKDLRGYLRTYNQRGSWDKADLIVDVLLYVEEWSKVVPDVCFYFCFFILSNRILSNRIASCRIVSCRNASNRIVAHQIVSYRISHVLVLNAWGSLPQSHCCRR